MGVGVLNDVNITISHGVGVKRLVVNEVEKIT